MATEFKKYKRGELVKVILRTLKVYGSGLGTAELAGLVKGRWGSVNQACIKLKAAGTIYSSGPEGKPLWRMTGAPVKPALAKPKKKAKEKAKTIPLNEVKQNNRWNIRSSEELAEAIHTGGNTSPVMTMSEEQSTIFRFFQSACLNVALITAQLSEWRDAAKTPERAVQAKIVIQGLEGALDAFVRTNHYYKHAVELVNKLPASL